MKNSKTDEITISDWLDKYENDDGTYNNITNVLQFAKFMNKAIKIFIYFANNFLFVENYDI